MGEIALQNIVKRFGDHDVIRNVSLTVKDGEFVVFVGPSGCGKSSLLRLITGLEDVTEGQVLIDGRNVTSLAPAERQLAMVFQSYALFPHLTVADNIGFGLRVSGRPKAEIRERVLTAARALELEPYLDRFPRQLSGGQRQRVAIGRAIVRAPTAFLFDEPLSNLDAALRVQMRLELIRLHDELKTTMIYVTHDQVEAMTMADRIVVLNAGRVEQFDTPIALYDAPANRFVAGFIGSPKMNFIDATAAGPARIETTAGGVDIANLEAPLPAGKLTFGIRPEHLHYDRHIGVWSGTILVEEQLGSDAYFTVDVKALGMLTVRAVGERGYRRGDTIFLTPDPDRSHVFDEDGNALARSKIPASGMREPQAQADTP
ncbi:ABC transporter ATP-binding protein [Shinella daejeonensis]|uniref:ABC transporter ATP-binding protein n=1 Tax=Shinella daejeonensis TaxID=659017 RepID=UPI0020C7D2F5|nr:ABC transporter ATP-binding protein [Shinella daejeonensis]MCP8894947.1 ABC transporter ATP-binding protein [Shinella daejeonensis]